MSLAGKIAMVTGAATGIGAATAVLLAERGAIVQASDVQEPGEVLAGALESGASLTFRELDVCSTEDWAAGVTALASEHGTPNVLVNNAGMLGSGEPAHRETREGMLRVFEVNVLSHVYGMAAVVPGMMESGGGAIVNVSSVWGLSAVPNNAAYQTAKGAALMLAKNAGVTYAPHGIRINCVLPGYVDTPMSRGVTAEEAGQLLAFTPLGRRGEPHELAPAIAFLVSDDASFVAAGVYPVDGGMAAL